MKIEISTILVDHTLNVSRDPITAESCQVLATTIGQRGQIVL